MPPGNPPTPHGEHGERREWRYERRGRCAARVPGPGVPRHQQHVPEDGVDERGSGTEDQTLLLHALSGRMLETGEKSRADNRLPVQAGQRVRHQLSLGGRWVRIGRTGGRGIMTG